MLEKRKRISSNPASKQADRQITMLVVVAVVVAAAACRQVLYCTRQG